MDEMTAAEICVLVGVYLPPSTTGALREKAAALGYVNVKGRHVGEGNLSSMLRDLGAGRLTIVKTQQPLPGLLAMATELETIS